MTTPPSRPVALVAVIGRSLSDLLESAGYDVMTASSGMRALDLAALARPDVVVVDAVLDDMSGTDACRLLRADPAIARHVPILIVLDGLPSPELRVGALRVGAWGFLSPSAGADEILQTIAAHVAAKRTVTEVVEEGLLEAISSFCSRPGLARRARELAALMSRVRGPLTCVVLSVEGRIPHDVGAAVARSVRISDVVGDLTPTSLAILAPGTDAVGALRLAERARDALLDVASRRQRDPGSVGLTISAGIDVAVNLRYSPVEPFAMLHRASKAVRGGVPDAGRPWIRRAVEGSRAGSTGIESAQAGPEFQAPPQHTNPEVLR